MALRMAEVYEQHDRDEDVLSTYVVHLLNITVIVSDENISHCKMCHMVNDAHSSMCPVPALEDWIATL